MKRADFSLKVLTPMFLRRELSSPAEWRLASLKGVMRFWLRAALGAFVSPHQKQGFLNLLDLESEVFGSTDRQSPVRLRSISQRKFPYANWVEYKNDEGINYLLGPGLNKSQKTPLMPGSIFTFRLCAPEPYFSLALGSLWLASFFGGLGARSRRGFGSFQLKVSGDAPDLPLPFEVEATEAQNFALFLENTLKTFLSFIKREFLKGRKYSSWEDKDLPSFPCFRANFWEGMVKESRKDERQALSVLGKYLRAFRIDGKALNLARPLFGEGKHTRDYLKIRKALKSNTTTIEFQNIVMGLPLNFPPREGKDGFFLQGSPRRPSPLFLSFSQNPKGELFLVGIGFLERFYKKNLRNFKISRKTKTNRQTKSELLDLRVKIPVDTKGAFDFLHAIKGISFGGAK